LAFFRHLGIAEKLVYKTRSEIENLYSDDLVKYFKAVKLPDGTTGPFNDLVFIKALNNVTSAWRKLYDGLKSQIVVAEVLKNWNLDTGVDMNSGQVTYWRLS
jgi:hypothetical protein